MRERRTFAERTKVLKSDEGKRKFFLVYEGASTEEIYFNALDNSGVYTDKNPLIELVPLIRSYSEDGWSNPKKILDRVIANLEEEKTGWITYESLLNRIMEYLNEQHILTTSKVQAKAIWNILETCCTKVLQKTLREDVEDIAKDCDILIKYLNKESEVDKICLVIDRDKDSFISTPNNRQYEYVVKTCKKKGFGLYVTNPCFEFWLLLHFDEVFCLDRDKLLENPQITSQRRYTEYELRKLLPGYTKSKYNVEALMSRVDKAVQNEKKFCEDIVKLEYEAGSNVGRLIEELK